MGLLSIRKSLGATLAVALLLTAAAAALDIASGEPKAQKTKPAANAASKAQIEEYLRAKAAFEKQGFTMIGPAAT